MFFKSGILHMVSNPFSYDVSNPYHQHFDGCLDLNLSVELAIVQMRSACLCVSLIINQVGSSP